MSRDQLGGKDQLSSVRSRPLDASSHPIDGSYARYTVVKGGRYRKWKAHYRPKRKPSGQRPNRKVSQEQTLADLVRDEFGW